MVDPRWEGESVQFDRATRTALERVAEEMAAIARRGPAVPGSLVRRYTRCGKPGCRCKGEPPRPHGPYWSWTRKIGNKTVTRYLSEEQHDDYAVLFENARRMRALLDELESLGLALVESDDRWRAER